MGYQQNRLDHAMKLMGLIRDIRTEHGACTAHEVARLAKLNKNLVSKQLQNLISVGWVEVTRIPGSLKLTRLGGQILTKSRAQQQQALDEAKATLEAENDTAPT